MKKYLLIVAALFGLASPARAADSTIANLPAASAIDGTELIYCVQSGFDRKCTPAQISTYIFGRGSGDCTISGSGTIICTKTNGVLFGSLATTVPGTGVPTALGINIGSAGAFTTFNGAMGTPSSIILTNGTLLPVGGLTGLGAGVPTALGIALSGSGGLTTTVAKGTAALNTSAIASGTCGTVTTVAATGVATTDVIRVGFNGDPTGTTGYLPTAMLTIVPYPSAGNVNFKQCNLTASSITPAALTLNWGVSR